MKVKVTFNNIIVGYTYDEGKTIEFLDNDKAKEVMKELNKGLPIGISSRSSATINDDDTINVGGLDEMNFI